MSDTPEQEPAAVKTPQPKKAPASERQRDELVYRAMTLECESSPAATRADGSPDTRIPVAISSEAKVQRYDWWTDERYYEVLDHDPANVDLSYGRDGLPFLLDHDGRIQVGLVEEPTLGEDRKLRGFVQMGNHPDAGWVEKDMRGGIRKKVSVGYRLGEYRIEKEEFEGLPVRRYRWMPVEVSSVPIPADYEVGVNRQAPRNGGRKAEPMVIPIRFQLEDGGTGTVNTTSELALSAPAERIAPADTRDTQDPPAPKAKERTMSEQVQTDGAAPVSTGPVVKGGVDQRTIAKEIAMICNAHGAADRIPEFLSAGYDVDQTKAALFDASVREASKVTPAGHLDMSDREAAQFSYTRAIQAHLNQRWAKDGGLEKEVSDTISKRMDRTTGGFFVPLDLKVRASATGNIVGTSSLGGAGVQTTVLSLIEILRNKMLVRQLGARVLSGLSGNITFPRQITANTMAWEGENPSTGHGLTAATLDNVALSPKTAMASTAYSRQLLIQSSFDVDGFVKDDLAQVLAIGLDLAALDGTGSNNQPTGIMRQDNVNVIVHTGTAAGGVPTFPEMVGYETVIANANADIANMAFVTTPGVRGKLKTTLKSTTAGSAYIWESDNTINGYAAHASAQVPSGLTYGTSTTVAHGIVFGVWSELLIGEWGGALEVIVDPYTLASQNMVAITQMILADVAVRHPASFAITKSALIA